MHSMEPADAAEMRHYNPAEIEPRWQQRWRNGGLYRVDNDGDGRVLRSPIGFGGNTIAYEHLVDRHGSDAVRLAILATKRPAENLVIEDSPLNGCERFLHRVWRLAATDEATIDRIVNTVRTGQPIEADRAVETATHVLIDRVTGNYEGEEFNTAVAAFMAFTNTLHRYVQSDEGPHGPTLAFAVDSMLLLMAPAVPHITAELWAIRHDGERIHTRSWPSADPDKLIVSPVTMVVQVDGRVRDRVEVPTGITAADAEALAIGSRRVQAQLGGREPTRIIVLAPRLVNVVV